jgi:putative oxidoreductase
MPWPSNGAPTHHHNVAGWPIYGAKRAACAGHLLPILLVPGPFTRASAPALLGMTAEIQICVCPDARPTHLSWVAALRYRAGRIAGQLSLDGRAGLR